MKKLKDKTIIIIGASGGIGSVLAREFSREGANITLVARNRENLEAAAEALEHDHLIFPADATDPLQIENAFEQTKKKFGKVDAVVISAGSWKKLSIDSEVGDAVNQSNSLYQSIFLPTFVVGYIAQRIFREQGYGQIFNISSHAAVRPELPKNLAYGPMKAAARHFMLALSHEANVRVSDLQPAIVNTPDAAESLNTAEKRAQAVQPESIAQWIIENFENPELPTEKLFDSTLVV